MANDLTDLLWLVARANLVLGAAIIAVLAVRGPARRVFGARIAYALWLIPPLAAAMCFAPLRVEHIVLPAASALTPSAPFMAAARTPTLPSIMTVGLTSVVLISIWAGGVFLHLLVLALRQWRFVGALGRLAPRRDLGARVYAAESAEHGPAVIGVWRPLIVTPSDFDHRFSADEQRIVLAHERAHMAQGDPLINACAALLQCLNWFNPLVHMAARALRVDQELACDAAVLATAESARRPYAEAILKTQIAQTPVPLGCAWPSPSPASLKERIAMLKRTLPSRAQTLLGGAVIAGTAFAACAVAWSAQPTRLVVTTAPEASPQPQSVAVEMHRIEKLARAGLASTASVQLASIELDGAPTFTDDQAAGAADDAARDRDRDRDGDRDRDHRSYDNRNGRVHVGEHSGIFSDQEAREINERGTLTPDQQARLDAYVQTRVQAAMQRVHETLARQEVRQHEIQERVRIATREATRSAERSHRYENYGMPPELRAEVEALSQSVSRLVAQETRFHTGDESDDRDHSPGYEAARAEVRRHADRIRELARQEHGDVDDNDDHDGDDDSHHSDHN